MSNLTRVQEAEGELLAEGYSIELHERLDKARWDDRFLRLADEVSTWSKDPAAKVGCVIVSPDRQIIATGYNGFPRGVEDSATRLYDKETKLAMVIHAEANAVLFADRHSLKGATAYVTRSPCSHCAGMLIQAGVKRICADDRIFTGSWAKVTELSREMCDEAGVEIDF